MSIPQSPNAHQDTEKAIPNTNTATNHDRDTASSLAMRKTYRTNTQPFIGRLGGNQSFISDPSKFSSVPDATPCMTLRSQFSLSGFRCISLWKAALLEGLGTFMLNFLTIWISSSPSVLPVAPNAQWGNFNNAAFLGPLVGGVTNWLLVTLFTYAFGAVTGAHLNPTITIATFFARLCSFPRMVLYVSFQTSFSALSGLMIRAALDTRDFKVGGCWLYTDVVSVSSAWVVEFVCCLTLLFLAFGVGLDPRQKMVIGPSLGPVLVGMVLGVVSFGSGFVRFGHGGASCNPARCLGVFVGGRWEGWHWIHWVADIAACMVHGVFYFLIPPWEELEELVQRQPIEKK